MKHYYVSRVFIDRDPESEIAGPKRGMTSIDPQSVAGQRALTAVSAWTAARQKPALRRDAMRCQFHATATDAQAEIEALKQDRTGYGFMESGIQ